MLTSGVPLGISRVAFLSHCGGSRCKGIHPACFVLDALSLNAFLSMIYDLFHKARIYMIMTMVCFAPIYLPDMQIVVKPCTKSMGCSGSGEGCQRS